MEIEASISDEARRRGVIISTIVHAAFFALIMAGAWMTWFRKPTPEHVFELVTLNVPATDTEAQPATVSPPPEEPVRLPRPETPPLKENRSQLEPMPDPPPALPEEPPPPAEPETRPMTYEEFLRQHGRPEPAASTPPPPPRTREVPRIDASEITRALRETLADTATRQRAARMSQAEQDALMAYIGQVRAHLNAAWRKPARAGGSNLEAVIRFTIEGDGRIVGVSVLQSSGNDLFDNSVLLAFREAGRVAPTPDGASKSIRLTFRMVD